MPDQPLVSIVTPSLNPGSRLIRCIESIEKQTYERIEHIVMDGGSTDGTVELLGTHPEIRWVSEPDTGQSNAINKGFRMSKGSILAWLNADDVLTKEATTIAVETLARPNGKAWIYGKLVVEGDDSFVLSPPPRVGADDMERGNLVPQPGSFYKKEALEAIGFLDESFHLAIDFDLFLRLLDSGAEGVYIDEVMAEFEIHPDSKNGKFPKWEFMREEAISLIKAGRREAAVNHFARAAVASVTSDGRVDGAKLRGKVAELHHVASQIDPSVQRIEIEAASRTEAAMVETQESVLGLRHLLSSGPWQNRSTRKRILRAIKTGSASVLAGRGLRVSDTRPESHKE